MMRIANGVFVGLLVMLAGAAAWGGGVRAVTFPPVRACARPVVVDGALEEWAGVDGVTYRPLDARLLEGEEPFLRAVRQWDLAVTVRWGYDRDALYLALAYTAPHLPRAGDSLTVHLRTDRVLHLTSLPADGGARLALSARVGDNAVAADAATAALARTATGYSEEIRIPWTLATPAGTLPSAGTLAVMLDFTWAELTPAQLRTLPVALLRPQTHFSMNVLTAPAKRYGRWGYLPNPAEWGTLHFAAGEATVTADADGTTGITDWYAKPAPATVDGTLDEWVTKEFNTIAYAPALLGARYSGAIAARYDAEKLYLAGRMTAPTPPHNLMRQETQQGYGGGDALQVRLNDGARTVNLCAWYDTQAGKPALTADGNDLPNPFLLTQGAQAAYHAEDGAYTFELAIPWTALRLPAPQADATWKATLQPWWAGLQREFTAAGTLTLQRQGALTVNYTLPADGEVTLGLYDAAGALQRWLTRADYRYAGANREAWDGLDQWGQPLPAGTYTVRGIVHPPLTTEYTLTLGNPGTPPWPTADGTGDWLSDEANPQAAATDGAWVFLAAPGSEKGWAIIAVDERGRRVWGMPVEYYPRSVALAVSGDYLYALFSGPELTDASRRFNGGTNAQERAILLCLEKRTGKLARFSKERPQCKIATWPYREEVVKLAMLRATHGYTPGVYAGQPRYFCNDIGESTGVLGVAVLNDRVYASFYYEDTLRVFDAVTAQPLDAMPLAKPVGLHAAHGTLYAVSGTRVVTIDPGSKRVTPLITTGLQAPHSLTTDAQGNLYVSDWGASFQVKVFSPAGTLLRAIGKAGGRPWTGAWEPGGVLVPRGVAVTNDGKLWVAEDDNTPKRVSVWDAKSGKLLRDYLGPTPYGGGTLFFVDPADTNIVCHSGLRWRVDWAKKTATPLATVFRATDPDMLFMPNGHGGMPAGLRHFTRQGKQYLALNGYHQVMVLLRQGEGYRPVAAAGGISRLITDDGTAFQVWDSDLGYHRYRNFFPAFFRGHAGDNYSWTDQNGDGRVQETEMRWVKTLSRGDLYVPGRQAEWMTFWGAGIGTDLSLYFNSFCRDKNITFRLDVQGWTPLGAPIYDIAGATELFTGLPNTAAACYVNAENRLFVTYRYEWRHPEEKNVLECRERDGALRWSVALPPEQPLAKDYHAENIVADFTLPGVGNVLGTWLWHGNFHPYLLTADGLFLGSLLQDTKNGPQATWDESFKYYFQTPNGTPCIVNGANDALHVLAVRGLEGSKRFTTQLTLTPEEVQAAAAARALPVVKAAPKPVIAMRWAAPAPTIDGTLDEWELRGGTTLAAEGGRGAQVALARDTETLYLAARVQDPTPLLNLGEDWQKLFITGDGVDLLLATDPKADPHRRAPAAGDVRLLFSVFQGQPIAVRYRPVVPGTTAPVQFMAAHIDEVRKLTAARVAVRRGAGEYTLEAAVPLRELGLDPAASDPVRGDVGVIFSDETGHNRTLRLYYYNTQTTVTADLTTEATLQPAAWGAITLPLGRNLLKNGSFEVPFTDKQDQGWRVGLEQQGAKAQLTTDGVHSGSQALLLAQTTPVVFTPEAYALPDYSAFITSANGGQGTGHLSLEQTVPVTAGKPYAFRLRYRAEDFQQEQRQPGPGRGYVGLTPYLFWIIPGKPSIPVGLTTVRESVADWHTVYNTQHGNYGVSRPYTAPDGATAAVISLKFTTAAARQPKIWIDDVEFVAVGE